MTCAEPKCERPPKTRGFCHRHYELHRRNGDLPRVRITDPVGRFWSYVDRSGDCWVWTAAKSTGGYGRVYWQGRLLQAHRVAYELEREPIPEGLEIDHLCRNRACVNPQHMEPVTTRTNLLRGEGVAAMKARRTHCDHGHELTPENVYLWHGARWCRTCRAAVRQQRVRPARRVVEAACVMCGGAFAYERGPGGRPPNVCSDDCRLARDRRKARDFARRKRASRAT